MNPASTLAVLVIAVGGAFVIERWHDPARYAIIVRRIQRATAARRVR